MYGLVALAGALDFLANWAAAHWLIPVGPFLVPAGTAFFTLSFTLADYLRRWHGRRSARPTRRPARGWSSASRTRATRRSIGTTDAA